MKQAAITVKEDLMADANLQAVVQGDHFWELAKESQKTPFITFRLSENKRISKDTDGTYDLEVFCFGKTLMAAAELSDLAKIALENANHRYNGGVSGYTDDQAREGYIKLNFNFNL